MATEDIGGPMTSHEVDAARLCFAPRNADGSVKGLPGVSYGLVNDAEIARRREQLREGHAAAKAEAALRYPADGGLKPQVRPYCETFSIDDAFEVERRRQQQDPAHDQGPFDGTEATVVINGQRYPVSHVRVSYENEAPPPVLTDTLFGRIDVTGTFTAYFHDEKLLDHFLYGPRWKRELKWALHNLVAHPLSEIAHWLGYLHPKIREWGLWLHDRTVPLHAPNTGRG